MYKSELTSMFASSQIQVYKVYIRDNCMVYTGVNKRGDVQQRQLK